MFFSIKWKKDGVLQEAGNATQGPIPDPKCRLIISSFLTLPHLLDCLICTRNVVSIVLLLQIMGGWDMWGVVHLYYGVGGGRGGGYHLMVFVFFFCFYILLSYVLSTFTQVARTLQLLCLFLCFFFIFLVSCPFN